MENGEKEFEMDIKVTPDEARKLEAAGFRTVSALPPSQISEDLRKEILRVLVTGDAKRSNAFTVSVAVQLQKLVQAAMQILQAERMAANDFGALLQKKNMNAISYNGAFFPQVIGGEDSMDGEDLMGTNMPFIGATKNENFGVQVIKELLAAAKTFQDSPTKDIEALAVARREGLLDVAASLEAKLGIAKPTTNEDLPK